MEELTIRVDALQIRRNIARDSRAMGMLEPVERAIFLASIDKPVKDYQAGELTAEINKAMKWITKDVGYLVKDDADWQYIVMRLGMILYRYYPSLSLKDVNLAFEMAVAGALDDFLPRLKDGTADRNHYQRFSAEYVCKILNAYVSRRGWVMKKAYGQMPKPDAPVLDDYSVQLLRDFRYCFLFYKYHNRLPEISDIAVMLYYGILEGVGLADEIEVTEAEQRFVFFRAMRQYMSKGMNYDCDRLRREGLDSSELRARAHSLARKRALLSTFDFIIVQEIQISDYVRFED